MRRIYAKEDACIGCHLCEIHCQAAHSRSGDILKAFTREKTPLSRITVNEVSPVSFALQCRQCPEPFCVYSCISGALYRDETGEIAHDPGRCVGCWTCVMVCTRAAIHPDPERGVAAMCDLCASRGKPACVENCPNEALVLIEEAD